MCSPSAALIAAGTAATAYGVSRQYEARGDAAQFNAAISRVNVGLGERAADDARDRGRHEIQQHKLRVHRLEGEQLSAFAAGGADVTQGSPLDVLESTAYLAAIDEQTMRANAEREAYRHEIDAYNASLRGELFEQEAQDAYDYGPIAALGAVASGAGRIYNVSVP